MVHPTDLHLAIVRNNPEAVRQKLEQYGVRTQAATTPEQLLELAYRLEGSCYIDILERLSDILAVPSDPDGAPIDASLVQEEDIKRALVLANGLANAPCDHTVVPSAQLVRAEHNYKLLLGIIAILLFLTVLLLMRSRSNA